MSVWTGIVLAILIFANALYVAAEFGAVGVRRSRVRRMAEDGRALAKRLLPYIESPTRLDRYVGASQIGITASSLMIGAVAQATLGGALGPMVESRLHVSPAAAVSIAAVSILVLLASVQLVLGELVPKALALQYPTEAALLTVVPLQWSLVLFRPAIWFLNGAATLILRAVGAVEQRHRHLHSPEEIDLLLTESRDGGLLEPEEQQRLRRALHLGLRTARDLMVPLNRLTTLQVTASWDDVVRTVAASPFSRIPIYRDSPNRIVGVLRVKDLLDRYAAEGPLPLERLMRTLPQLVETLGADRVLTELRARRAHAAVVVDPVGRATGLVTIQDVIGELLGYRAEAAPRSGTSARRDGTP